MSRNIFYASNTQSELFPYNTRTHFNQYVDVHNLDYIKQDDIEVAVKSIAFDNTQSIHILPTIEQPHIMIVQEISEQEPYEQFMWTILNTKGVKSGVRKSLKNEKKIEEVIDISGSNDFVIVNDCNAGGIIVQSHLDREFSNILFISNNTIIHHIYLHYKECFYLDTFINVILCISNYTRLGEQGTWTPSQNTLILLNKNLKIYESVVDKEVNIGQKAYDFPMVSQAAFEN